MKKIIILILFLVGCSNSKYITPEKAYDMIDNDNVIFLDVRESFEYNGGHLKNSINIPLDELENNLYQLDKDKTIIVYCFSGNRAQIALEILSNNGYKKIYTFGGTTNWEYELYTLTWIIYFNMNYIL